ncbi:acetolactate decarboxylase [Methanolobus chelungpuianus]|uniref:Alpha-acetolactate decarboxylase n=1 Tax=Methanolobus chelungpuianus TaxID=502115 RepID=A0AAE3HC12_9EURY|nr:acetolactate decarboxylase [Methanolobus chelungpuianus]MCQ6963303.1 alpha-acetolactate decarboxylase [Methanolobus chelungpuianus]
MGQSKLITIALLLMSGILLSGCLNTDDTDDSFSTADFDKGSGDTGTTLAYNSDTLYQVSTINALLEGVYDGDTSLRTLKGHGDFGIGTFNALDGEMIMLDGEIYQVKDDGIAYLSNDSMTTPFAAVTFFEGDETLLINETMSKEELEEHLENMMPNRNIMYAVKITGTFDHMKTRSVPRQEQPYPKLVEVTKNQPTFEFTSVQGTIVGFWLPAYMNGVNVPEYHLHFITDGMDAGGHILEYDISEGTVEIDRTYDFYLSLPRDESFMDADLEKDNSSELEMVEK